MNKIVHYIGLDVHKDSIAVAIAPQNTTEVRRYGIIGGTLDAVDKLLKRLSQPNIELRLVYEAGPCGFVLCRHLRSKDIQVRSGLSFAHPQKSFRSCEDRPAGCRS